MQGASNCARREQLCEVRADSRGVAAARGASRRARCKQMREERFECGEDAAPVRLFRYKVLSSNEDQDSNVPPKWLTLENSTHIPSILSFSFTARSGEGKRTTETTPR